MKQRQDQQIREKQEKMRQKHQKKEERLRMYETQQ